MFRSAAFWGGSDAAGASSGDRDGIASFGGVDRSDAGGSRGDGEPFGRAEPELAEVSLGTLGDAPEDDARHGSSSFVVVRDEDDPDMAADGTSARSRSASDACGGEAARAPVQSLGPGALDEGKGRGREVVGEGGARSADAEGGEEGRAADGGQTGVEGGRAAERGVEEPDEEPRGSDAARDGSGSARAIAEASPSLQLASAEPSGSATGSATDAAPGPVAGPVSSVSGHAMHDALAVAIKDAIEEAVRSVLGGRPSADAPPRRPSGDDCTAQGTGLQALTSPGVFSAAAGKIAGFLSASRQADTPPAAEDATAGPSSASLLAAATTPVSKGAKSCAAVAPPASSSTASVPFQHLDASDMGETVPAAQLSPAAAKRDVAAARPTGTSAAKRSASPAASPSLTSTKLASVPKKGAGTTSQAKASLPNTTAPAARAPLPTSLASFSFWAAEDRVPSVEPGPFSAAESAALRSLVGQLESRGMIRESKSKYASRALLLDADGRDSIVPTAVVGDRRVQLGVDWRGLDAAMSLAKVALYKNAIPHQRLTEARFFSRIDLRGGSLRMPLREGTRRFTAFWTPLGTYEWCVVPSGLRGVTTAFAHALSDLFRNAAVCESTVVLPSAVVVFSETHERHVRDLAAVGDVLRRVRLEPNAWGSSYYASEVELQGLRVRDGKIEVAPSRYAALERLQLGKAKCAGTEQLWRRNLHPKHHGAEDRGADGVQNIVLTEMKRVLAPVSGPFVLYVAFRKSPVGAVGGFLARRSYLGGLKQEEVVAFASRRTKIPASIHKQYALAVAACLDEFRPIIAGHKVEVRCSLGPIEQLVDGNVSAEAVAIANDLREFGASVSYCPIGSNQVARMLAG